MKKMFLWALSSTLFFACNNEKVAGTKTDTNPAAATTAESMPAEFADIKYAEMVRNGLNALSSGDVDGFVNGYADNAVYQWNYGDSIVGKANIATYWKKRRTEVIDSIVFSNTIFLPIKVNQPQSNEQAGVWLLSWYQVDAKYKTGKKMTQSIHTALHFNDADQIDRSIQYLDRMPIAAAMAK